MINSLVSFIFYAFAMVGIILVGVVVAKKSVNFGYFNGRRNNFLSVESFLALEPRKNIYVLKAGSERFLISTDSNGSHMLTKLDDNNMPVERSEDMPLQVSLPEYQPEVSFGQWAQTPFFQRFVKDKNVSDIFTEKINK